ncbi:hypothetical protein ACTG9Q_15870 [Actinokineospora sp. 24-640]
MLSTTYDGLTTTTAQVVGDASKPAITKTTVDALGQIITVAEATGPSTWATTQYRGDATGRSKITDPDGVVTDMEHNGFGERVKITTGGKTWSYAYDRNGNQTKTIEPHESGDAPDYTHTRVYDVANRVVKEIPAPRALSSAQQTELKFGERTFTYDRPTAADIVPGQGDINDATGEANHTIGMLVAVTSTPQVVRALLPR